MHGPLNVICSILLFFYSDYSCFILQSCQHFRLKSITSRMAGEWQIRKYQKNCSIMELLFWNMRGGTEENNEIFSEVSWFPR